ncbi:hypothetical protein NC651_025218 [Populus alba x Populus x berolinensis]|nr:hypothetical protein NC651_025218 [Populus alba x Populus x berolinensis]
MPPSTVDDNHHGHCSIHRCLSIHLKVDLSCDHNSLLLPVMNLAILQPECCHPPRNETAPTIEQQQQLSRAMERETERQNQNFELSEGCSGRHHSLRKEEEGAEHLAR